MKQTLKTTVLIACMAALSAATVTITGCAGDSTSRSTGAYLDDKSLTSRVKTEFATDPAIKASDINIETYKGQVQLNGFVDTQGQKQRAEEIARRVEGVVSVQNNLSVKEAAGSAKPQ